MTTAIAEFFAFRPLFWILAVTAAIFFTSGPTEARRQVRSDDGNEGTTSRHACEGNWLNISCPHGQVIHIVIANYGRYAKEVCNDDGIDWPNTYCSHGSTLEIMRERCENQVACSVPASNEAFITDPCPRINKYLDVSYRCKEAPTTTLPPPTPKPPTSPEYINPPEDENVPATATESAGRMDVREPETKTEAPEKPKFCPETYARDIQWPKTELGHSADQLCPNDQEHFAHWFCGTNGSWIGTSPDLSKCVSQWAKNVEMSSKHIHSEQAALTVARKVHDEVFTKPLYGGDTIVLSNVLETVAIKSKELLEDRSVVVKRAASQDLGRVLVHTGNNLIHENNRKAWDDLDRESRIRSANSILDSIEMNADLLGTTMGRGDQTVTEKGPGDYIVMEVTVVQVQAYVQFPSMSFFDKKVDIIRVPQEAFAKTGQGDSASVVFAQYKNVGDFLQPNPVRMERKGRSHLVERKIVSKVITAHVAGKTSVKDLKEPVLITMKIKKEDDLTNPQCVFWDKRKGQYGRWSSEGCETVDTNDTHAVCSCNHLTNFAVLMDVKGLGFSYMDTVFLSFITYIGFVISIVCLTLSIFAFCIMRGSSSDRVTIHVNLCLCLLIAELVFIFGIPQTQFVTACSVIAGVLHYFFLAAFAWMLLEGFQLYALLVEVFETENSRKKWFYLFGYGIPAVIVGISVVIDRESYGTDRYCWLRTDNYFVLSFVGPVIVVLAANAVLLTMAIVIMCRHSHLSVGYRHCQHRNTLENMGVWLKGAVILVFLLGLTWGFGLLYINKSTTVMAYLFTILNSLQGLFIFLFHVVLNDKMRKEYRKWVRRNDWLPTCLRDSTLTDYQPANGLQKVPTHSSSHGTASSPVPLSDSSGSGQMYLSKFLQGTKSEPRYNSSAQLLLGKYGSYEVSHKYDYAFVHGLSESSEEGTNTMISPLSIDTPADFMNFIHMERCHPHRPPPNFPPPQPPVYQDSSDFTRRNDEILPTDVLVQSLDGRIAFDLSSGDRRFDPESTADRYSMKRRPISAKSSCHSANSDDSAYSDGSGNSSSNLVPRTNPPSAAAPVSIRQYRYREEPTQTAASTVLRRELSTSPDSMLNCTSDSNGRGEHNPPQSTVGVTKKLGVLNSPSLPVEEETEGADHSNSVMSLPDLSYEVPRATAARFSPSLLSPLPSPTTGGTGDYGPRICPESLMHTPSCPPPALREARSGYKTVIAGGR